MKQPEVKFPHVVTAFEAIGLLAVAFGLLAAAVAILYHDSGFGSVVIEGLAGSVGGMFFLAIAECLIKLCQIEAHLRGSRGDAE